MEAEQVSSLASLLVHSVSMSIIASEEEELELLVSQTGLSAEEVREYYNRFCISGHGANIITRQVFSQIMAKCFPRTYKVSLDERLKGV